MNTMSEAIVNQTPGQESTLTESSACWMLGVSEEWRPTNGFVLYELTEMKPGCRWKGKEWSANAKFDPPDTLASGGLKIFVPKTSYAKQIQMSNQIFWVPVCVTPMSCMVKGRVRKFIVIERQHETIEAAYHKLMAGSVRPDLPGVSTINVMGSSMLGHSHIAASHSASSTQIQECERPGSASTISYNAVGRGRWLPPQNDIRLAAYASATLQTPPFYQLDTSIPNAPRPSGLTNTHGFDHRVQDTPATPALRHHLTAPLSGASAAPAAFAAPDLQHPSHPAISIRAHRLDCTQSVPSSHHPAQLDARTGSSSFHCSPSASQPDPSPAAAHRHPTHRLHLNRLSAANANALAATSASPAAGACAASVCGSRPLHGKRPLDAAPAALPARRQRPPPSAAPLPPAGGGSDPSPAPPVANVPPRLAASRPPAARPRARSSRPQPAAPAAVAALAAGGAAAEEVILIDDEGGEESGGGAASRRGAEGPLADARSESAAGDAGLAEAVGDGEGVRAEAAAEAGGAEEFGGKEEFCGKEDGVFLFLLRALSTGDLGGGHTVFQLLGRGAGPDGGRLLVKVGDGQT